MAAIQAQTTIALNLIRISCDGEKNGKFALTGYESNDTKEAAQKSISSVIADYGNSPEFLGVYAQVGAVLTSYGYKISKSVKKSNIQIDNLKSRLERDEKILYQSAKVNVNGVVRECKSGLVQGFKNAVSKVDGLRKENIELKNENRNLRRRIQGLTTGIER